MEIKKIAVAGNGIMGKDIARLAASSGYPVMMYGRNREHVGQAIRNIREGLLRQAAKGKLPGEDVDPIMARLSGTDRMEDAAGADLVIEALAEDLEVKRDFFARMEGLCGEDTILATNTSSLPITGIASALKHPERMIGLHFFHPASAMKLCEMIPGEKTSEDVYAAARAFCEGMGRICVRVRRDAPGFIVNRILFAYFLECIHIYEEGIASIEDIDLAVRYGLNHPLGPFALMDMGGLDTFPSVCEALQQIDPDRFACPESVRKLAADGKFGRKTGEGWFQY